MVSFDMHTDLYCQAPHPIPAAANRKHLAFITAVPGRYVFTGEVVQKGHRKLEGHAYAWCSKCHRTSVYRQVAEAAA